MAELLLKVHDESGDCLCAFSDFRISRKHCEIQCRELAGPDRRRRLKGSDRDGILTGSRAVMAQAWQEATRTLKFTRTGSQVHVVDLLTGNESTNPAHVAHIKRLRDSPLFPVFGTLGNEVWYGGRTIHDPVKISEVWSVVENERQVGRDSGQFRQSPEVGQMSLKTQIVLPVVDFEEDEADRIIEPEFKTAPNGKFIWRRADVAHQVTDTDDRLNLPHEETEGGPDLADVPDAKPNESPWEPVRVNARRNRALSLAKLRSDLGISKRDMQDHTVRIDVRAHARFSDTDLLFDKARGGKRRRFGQRNRKP